MTPSSHSLAEQQRIRADMERQGGGIEILHQHSHTTPSGFAINFTVGRITKSKNLPETASEKVGGVASACSALAAVSEIAERRELDVNASMSGVTGGESAAANSRSSRPAIPGETSKAGAGIAHPAPATQSSDIIVMRHSNIASGS